MEVIKFTNVNFAYKNADGQGNIALKNINLAINQGEFIALVGHNGSGKSTLAKMMNGLLLPGSGSVEAFGFNTAKKETIFEVRKRVGVVFQNPDNQMVASIVEEDVAFGPENLGIAREEIIERVNFALSAVGMLEHKKSTPFKMSGGQKQRIAIAGVLAMLPKVLVLDESTAMLDPRGRLEVIEVIKQLNKQEKITVVLITHYMEEAFDADRVVIMDGGEIVGEGKPIEVFKNYELIDKTKLCLPVILNIKRKLEQCGFKLNSNAVTVKDLAEDICRLL